VSEIVGCDGANAVLCCGTANYRMSKTRKRAEGVNTRCQAQKLDEQLGSMCNRYIGEADQIPTVRSELLS
jgi:hypothetical protein